MLRTASTLVCILAVVALSAADKPKARLADEDIVGFWRIAYEPSAAGREGLSELSAGYLAFMPNGEYFEIRDDCCDGPVAMSAPRKYRIEEATVVLSRQRYDGSSYEARLHDRGVAVVAFPEGKRTFRTERTRVLSVGKASLNYCWAKVYP